MKMNLWYYWNTSSFAVKGGEVEVSAYQRDLTTWQDRILLQQIVIDIPDCPAPTREDQISGLLDNLAGLRSEIQADAHMKIKAIDDKVAQLLCLTCDTSEGGEA